MSADLSVGICGPMIVVREECRQPTIPAAQRTVLGLLALHCGVAVQLDSLYSVLWPDMPPASAAGIVHTYVSRLRRQLQSDDEKARIVRKGGGYAILLAEDELDVSAFRRLAGQARNEPDAYRACELYERALSLWRGNPVEDVEALRHHPAAVALSNERLAVTLEYVQRAVAAEQHDTLLPHLTALVPGNPHDERLHAALMMVLAGSGRQAEALDVYERLRVRLDEELGMLPGDELREAHTRVLRQEVTSGSRQAVWREVQQLPAASVDFTGREPEAGTLADSMRASGDVLGVPVLVVCGQPGVGKTALALYAAHSIRDGFPDGQLWVHLAGASAHPRDPAEVLGEMLRAIGVPGSAIPEGVRDRSAMFRSKLAGRRVLVVADDAASVEQVLPLVPGTSGSALIVTSRVQLYGLPGTVHIPLDGLAVHDAMDLLARLAGRDRIAAESDAAAELVAVCGGLPLALRIVGGKLATRPKWPVSVMLRGFARAERRLSELEGGGLSVRASISTSYAALPERHRLAFRRLGILGANDFAGWVVSVLLDDGDGADVLNNLVRVSLVAPASVDATGEPRYRLHDLVREFAIEQLSRDSAEEMKATTERMMNAWIQLAMAARAQLPPAHFFPPARAVLTHSILDDQLVTELTREPITWFLAERQNTMAAVRSGAAGHRTYARRIAKLHDSFHSVQDRYDDAESMWRTVMADSDRSAEDVWCRLHVAAAMHERGRSAAALSVVDGCMAAAEGMESKDPELLAFVCYWRSACLWAMGEYERARHDGERGVELAQRAGLRLAEMNNLRRVSDAEVHLGDKQAALVSAERAVGISRELRNDWYAIEAMHSLGYVCNMAGLHREAVSACLEALAMQQRVMVNPRLRALSHAVLGDAYRGLGRYEEAIHCFHAAIPVFRTYGTERHLGRCLHLLGLAYEAVGQHEQATECLRSAEKISRDLGLSR
jgi:DNA-binding SARP family transcriptional activator/tetratricopeptide (TPR) repeat protein